MVIAINKKIITYNEEEKREEDYIKARKADCFSFMCAGLSDKIHRKVLAGSEPSKDLELKESIAVEIAFRPKHTINEISEESGEAKETADTEKSKDTDPAKENETIAAIQTSIEGIKKSFKCFNCGEFRHLRRQCTKPPKQGQNRGRGGYNNRGGGGNNNNWRGGYRGRGPWRGGRGRGGGYGRGGGGSYGYGSGYNRGGYTPPAYFGQPNYYQQQSQGYGGPRYPAVQYMNQQPPPPPDYGMQGNNYQQYEIIESEN